MSVPPPRPEQNPGQSTEQGTGQSPDARPQPRSWSGPNRTGQTQVNFLSGPVARRLLTVTRAEDLTPRYRRVYLTGEALADGFPYVRFAPTDHVKVLFPQPETGELILPTPGERGWQMPEGAAKPITRDYTVRGWLPQTRELVLEFVIHGHGVASAWASEAKVGDEIGVMGPRGNIVFPENYAWYLLAGDEAALPSMARFLEELPDGAGAHAFIEVADANEKQELPRRPGVKVTWVLRDAAGTGGLERAVRDVELPEGEDWFVFAAGEVGMLRPVRDYFRKELGLPRERVVVDGYWKRGVENLDHHAVDLNAD